jgi:hypothetical protein
MWLYISLCGTASTFTTWGCNHCPTGEWSGAYGQRGQRTEHHRDSWHARRLPHQPPPAPVPAGQAASRMCVCGMCGTHSRLMHITRSAVPNFSFNTDMAPCLFFPLHSKIGKTTHWKLMGPLKTLACFCAASTTHINRNVRVHWLNLSAYPHAQELASRSAHEGVSPYVPTPSGEIHTPWLDTLCASVLCMSSCPFLVFFFFGLPSFSA